MTSLALDVLPGTAPPRVRCAPVHGTSEADDAAWFASSYGLRPDPWQHGVLADWLRSSAGRWLASRCGLAVPRQNGKNGVLEVRELYGMVALGERFLHTAHEVKTARKAFARLLEFFDNPRIYPELHDLVREIRKTNGQEAIVLTNGGSVEFIARSKGSGRGFSVDVLVCDEAQQMSDDDYQALRPTISASPNPQVILTGTPPPPGRDAPVWSRMRATGVAGEDARLAWSEWSCPDDLSDVDVFGFDVLAATNPALGVRLLKETVEDERDMGLEGYARERLGWWEPQEARSGAVDVTTWQGLADPQAERGSPVAFGAAVSPDGDWSAISVAWRRPDGLVHVMLADYLPGTAWLAGRIDDLERSWAGKCLRHPSAKGHAGDDVVSGNTVAAADNAFVNAVTNRGLRWNPTDSLGDQNGALTFAVKAARWKPSGDSRVLDRKGAADISPLVAAALALHGLTETPKNRPGRFVSF